MVERAAETGLAFGSNVGDRAAMISRALALVEARVGKVLARSSIWSTPPWGKTDQPDFLNACALVTTHLAPHDLLAAAKSIEIELGRVPGEHWGPRVIDIDLLFYDDAAVRDERLELPHPHLFQRAFVLAPLAEIAPDRVVSGRRIANALDAVDKTGVKRLGPIPTDGGEQIMGEWIKLTGADGVTISAWLAKPTGTPKGGMVVLQEIFGVNHHMRAVTDRFAAAGYLAVAPALFDRVERGVELGYDGADRPRAMEIRGRTKIDNTLMDIAAAIAVAADGGKVGVVGYCWGGSLAWVSAARLPGIAAAVGYYGGAIATNHTLMPQAPTMLHFGALDQHIPLSDVEKIRVAHPAVPIFVYDADHGFNCDERSSYNAAAADAARVRTLEFFKTVLC